MPLELHVLSGARAGQRATFDQAVVTVGRHPACDFRFDPEQDREVSTRHAELRHLDDRWVAVDLNSTNGLFLNGQRLHGEAELRAGDVLSFGATGPRLEVALPAADAAAPRFSPGATRVSWGGRGPGGPFPGAGAAPAPRATAPAAAADASAGYTPILPRARADGPTPTSVRIAAAVQESTKGLRRMLIGVSAVLVVAVGGAIAWSQYRADQYERRIGELLDEVKRRQTAWDAQYGAIAGRVASLDSAYQTEKTRSQGLQAQLEDAVRRGSPEEIEELRKRLTDSQNKTRGIVAAAAMDPRKVNVKSGPGVVLVTVKQQDGKAFSGSGFNVLPGGLIVTNRHVVQDPTGRPVAAVAVMFAGKHGEWLPAHVVKTGTSRDDDLALLQLDAAGTYPVVAGVAPSQRAITVGDPVTTIGFPLGTDLKGLEGDIDTITAASTLTAGTVSKMLGTLVQLDSYSGEGASGSPVFDGNGHVVGVIFGGAPGSGGRIVYAVPSERVLALLPGDAAGAVRR